MNFFYIFISIGNILFMYFVYKKIKRDFLPEKILSNIRVEINNLITDLNRETERDIALIEDKMEHLKKLLIDTDKRLFLAQKEQIKKEKEQEVLQNFFDQKEDVNPNIKHGLKNTESLPSSFSDLDKESGIKVYTKNNFMKRANPIQQTIPLNEQVIEMHNKGLSADFIASSLSMPLGEVELIIDIRSL